MRWREITKEEKVKIITAKFENPDLSVRDISDSTWISKTTVANTINETPEILESLDRTDEALEQIKRLDSIIWGIEVITSKLVNKLQLQEEITVNDVKQLNDISKTNWERKRLLQWESTSNINLIWDLLSEIQGMK